MPSEPTNSIPLTHSIEAANDITYKPCPAWKRVSDITLCSVAILILSPLLLLISVWVKLSSRGPLLFKHERIGLNGRSFICLKFRTMKQGASHNIHKEHLKKVIEQGLPLHKLDSQGDSRLVPGAWILRASGLDELPQLFNVLRGEMSLVGPRPCVPFEYEQFSDSQKRRCSILPGLTGLWQVSGKNDTTLEEMISLDIEYSQRMSPVRDLYIMAMTVPTLVLQLIRLNPHRKDGRVDS